MDPTNRFVVGGMTKKTSMPIINRNSQNMSAYYSGAGPAVGSLPQTLVRIQSEKTGMLPAASANAAATGGLGAGGLSSNVGLRRLKKIMTDGTATTTAQQDTICSGKENASSAGGLPQNWRAGTVQ